MEKINDFNDMYVAGCFSRNSLIEENLIKYLRRFTYTKYCCSLTKLRIYVTCHTEAVSVINPYQTCTASIEKRTERSPIQVDDNASDQSVTQQNRTLKASEKIRLDFSYESSG